MRHLFICLPLLLLLLSMASPSWASNEHSVSSIVQALKAPIPPNAADKARQIDDIIMSTGKDADGVKVYLITNEHSKRLNDLVSRLLTTMGENDREWVVRVLDTKPAILNARVHGGKYIYVYTGLLNEVKSADEVALVLAHELGHSLLKHLIRREMDTTNALAGLAEVITGLAAKNSFKQVAAVTGALKASYSRTDEEEADAIAVAISFRAGFDPLRGADFFTRLIRISDDGQEAERQQLAQAEAEVQQAVSQCQNLYAAAQANPSYNNHAQASCNAAHQKYAKLSETVEQYNQNYQKLTESAISAGHPSPQSRVAAIAALTDYLQGRRTEDSLQQYQQSYRVMVALRETNSVLLKGRALTTEPSLNKTVLGGATGGDALLNAASKGEVEKLRKLLRNGADPNVKGKNGETALFLAVANGYVETARILLARGADVDAKGPNGGTALLVAAAKGNTELVRRLLDSGADIHVRLQTGEKAGETALSLAVARNHSEVALLLLDRGADPDMRNLRGQTPTAIARGNGHTDLAKLLEDRGKSQPPLSSASPQHGTQTGDSKSQETARKTQDNLPDQIEEKQPIDLKRSSSKTLAEQLQELKEAFGLGLITEEEYQMKRQRILGN